MFAPATLILVALATTVAGLILGGAGAERPILDPGAVVRFGGPIARMFVNLASAMLVGSLVLVLWAFKDKSREFRAGLDIAAGSAAVLTVSSLATMVFAFIEMSGVGFSLDEQFGSALAQFGGEVVLGQLWVWMLVLGALTTVVCFAVTDRRLVLVALGMALAALMPLAQQGHAQGASGHALAVNSLYIHLAGVSAWLGGLLTILLISRVVDRPRLSTITERYSGIALLAYAAVTISGVVSAWMRVSGVDDLFGTGYGQLVILKTLALIALGIFGALHRRYFIPRMASDGAKGARAFAWFAVAELAIMGVASGFAAALGRTQTPVPIEPAYLQEGDRITPAEYLTGDPLPPPMTPEVFMTLWKWDLLWVVIPVFAVALYLAGVRRLRRRGDTWPVGRTIAWILGFALLFYTTNGALNAYERYVFSVHMLGHMLLTMLIPLILVLAAPVTLLLRAVPKRDDGSWGAREWVMWAIHTPYSKLITHPIVAAVIFAGSLWLFYFTPMLEWAMRDHLGHEWMIIHFLISGYLFSLSMIGVDPVPMRFPHAMRLLILFATMAAHAFFGVTIMSMTGMLVPDWFGAMGREWGFPPLQDQSVGGSIAWGIGELPTLALAVLVAYQWMKDDDRVQKRRDRAADRSDEAELRAYNEMLAEQAKRDELAGL